MCPCWYGRSAPFEIVGHGAAHGSQPRTPLRVHRAYDRNRMRPRRTICDDVRCHGEFTDQFAVDPYIRRAEPAQNAGVPDEIDTPLPRVRRLVLRVEGGGPCCAGLQ